jgi:alanine racemase
MKGFRPSGRPTLAEIDLKALEFNYRQLRKRVPKTAKILGVVKADAYGHGAVPISRKLETLGIAYLGVATSDEGMGLRRGGVKAPILLMGGIFSEEEVGRVVRLNLTPVVFNRESLRVLSRQTKHCGKKTKIHLKVDTGMGRLGVPADDLHLFLEEVRQHRGLEVEGILSHFAMADETESRFTAEQWAKFQRAVTMAEEMGIPYRYLHVANSASLTAFPLSSGNLVRPGIMLYGSYPSPALHDIIKLKPLMTLKTRIHFLKSVPPGTRISYGGTFVTRRESLIATLPIGYADGYNRQLSNQGEVLVRGRRAPVVGRVTMDFIMVDVTDVPKVALGDEVVLIGKQGRERITAEDVAQKINSISYEVFCAIGKRVPRVYRSGRDVLGMA